MTYSLEFDAVNEERPGPKWAARWARSWPAYEAWFIARGGDSGPSRSACEAALAEHMPELVPVHRKLCALAGGSDRAARFLSTWCPPTYLGGCSLAAVARGDAVRLVRNYDLSPDLNEGLMLRSAWVDRPGVGPVMGMVEFLWGLSDGINGAGLSIALAYGGRQTAGEGFGITTILRYVLETCATVPEALKVLRRVPSHMPYNVVLADATGATASVELFAGGGAALRPLAVAVNHQNDGSTPDRAPFTKTYDRLAHLADLVSGSDADQGVAPTDLAAAFLAPPLRQERFAQGFGTLFTAEYDPCGGDLTLHWPNEVWHQSLDAFVEGHRRIDYAASGAPVGPQAAGRAEEWSDHDWSAVDWAEMNWAEMNWAGIDWAAMDGAGWIALFRSGPGATTEAA